ncbi:MAG TPA: histidinol phosphate phosphatase [Patescibacteria group bacterium]|nr:histidinol phosphate phosphatase [Patescibacteria group bacterium]
MRMDTHLHTTVSTDSRMTLAEAMDRARQLGLGITLTEHMDLSYPRPDAFLFDVDRYFDAYGAYRSQEVLLGIEVGMRVDCREENRRLAARTDFDYVLGSVHVIDNMDLYDTGFYQERDKPSAYRHYLQAMLECVTTHDFIDSLGHIDYIARYARYDDPELRYSEHAEEIDAVLTALAQREKALEINTRRLDRPDAAVALLQICQRFRQLGGHHVTIGSDAHQPEAIGRGMDAAEEIAERSGLKVVWFRERKPFYAD